MPTLSRILVPTDLTPSAKLALKHAVALVKRTGAELHLVHILEEIEGGERKGVGNLKSVYDRLREVLSVEMRMEVREEAGPDFEAHQHIRQAAGAARGILDYAAEHQIDLIVMGTHGRQGADRFLIGSTAERVVRFAGCHVLTVGPQGSWIPGEVRRVLVAVDFSEYADHVLHWGHRLATHYEARLDLLHVIEPVVRPVFYGRSNAGFDFSGAQMEDRARNELKRLYRTVIGAEVKGQVYIGRGRAAQEIVRVARENDINVIVQGAQGLTDEEHVPLGHVAEELVRRAPCPVFTAKGSTDTQE